MSVELIEHVFVDESGATYLANAGDNPDFYVICGILVPDQDLSLARQAAFKIVDKHAGSGQLRSSTIGNDTKRRMRILEDIGGERLPFYCLVVDKRRIFKDTGLKWKSSFYKFLHKMFYAKIKQVFIGISVVADLYGRSEFMASFKEYIEDRSSLFDKFEFEQSLNNELLQIADMIAGSVRRVYMGDDSEDILRALGYPSIPIEVWPPLAKPPNQDIGDSDQMDNLVLGLAIDRARTFVELKIQSNDEESKVQAETIRYLLYRLHHNPEEYVYRAEVIGHIYKTTGITLNEQLFSATVLAIARDHGVLIASTEKGVKIPYNTNDLFQWISRANSQITPYLQRIESARNMVLLASNNQFDIVNPNNFPDLSKYLQRT